MDDKIITLRCYQKIKELYIDNEYLLYEFPCTLLEGPELGNGDKMLDVALRKMDVPTPPEIESLWEYDSLYTDNYLDEDNRE